MPAIRQDQYIYSTYNRYIMKKLNKGLLVLACAWLAISSCNDNSNSTTDSAKARDTVKTTKDTTKKSDYNPAAPAARNAEY